MEYSSSDTEQLPEISEDISHQLNNSRVNSLVERIKNHIHTEIPHTITKLENETLSLLLYSNGYRRLRHNGNRENIDDIADKIRIILCYFREIFRISSDGTIRLEFQYIMRDIFEFVQNNMFSEPFYDIIFTKTNGERINTRISLCLNEGKHHYTLESESAESYMYNYFYFVLHLLDVYKRINNNVEF
jgi:hypothetical protein